MKTLQNNFTTPEQSKRLLELGVPTDSADCYYTETNIEGNMYWFEINVKREYQPHSCLHASLIWGKTLPCWSVSRLMEICKICVVDKEALAEIFEELRDCGDETKSLIKIFDEYSDVLDFSKLEE